MLEAEAKHHSCFPTPSEGSFAGICCCYDKDRSSSDTADFHSENRGAVDNGWLFPAGRVIFLHAKAYSLGPQLTWVREKGWGHRASMGLQVSQLCAVGRGQVVAGNLNPILAPP